VESRWTKAQCNASWWWTTTVALRELVMSYLGSSGYQVEGGGDGAASAPAWRVTAPIWSCSI